MNRALLLFALLLVPATQGAVVVADGPAVVLLEPGQPQDLEIDVSRFCQNAAMVMEEQVVHVDISAENDLQFRGPTSLHFPEWVCAQGTQQGLTLELEIEAGPSMVAHRESRFSVWLTPEGGTDALSADSVYIYMATAILDYAATLVAEPSQGVLKSTTGWIDVNFRVNANGATSVQIMDAPGRDDFTVNPSELVVVDAYDNSLQTLRVFVEGPTTGWLSREVPVMIQFGSAADPADLSYKGTEVPGTLELDNRHPDPATRAAGHLGGPLIYVSLALIAGALAAWKWVPRKS